MKINNNILSDTQKNFQFSQLKTNVGLNVFVLFIFIIAYFILLSPELETVKVNKNTLQQEYDRYTNMEKKGLSLNELASAFPEESADQKILVQNGGEDLFNSIFSNNTNKNYIDFLKEKETILSETKQSDFLVQRDLKVANALPFFGDGIDLSKGVITELSFTSYIERLIKTFNLSVSGNFSAGDIEMVNPEELKDQKNSYASQMFYNEMNLKISGKKSDIVDFIHFTENVGNVSLVNNDGNEDIVFYTDGVIRRKIFSTLPQSSTNIYENMLMEIVNIKMPEYIDESNVNRGELQQTTPGFIDFIKSTADNSEMFAIDVTLRFYMRGLPLYKKEVYVKEFLGKFDSLKSDINSTLQKSKNRSLQKTNVKMIDVVNTLTSLKIYVDNLDIKVKSMRAGLNQKANVEGIYNNAYMMGKDLKIIEDTLKKATSILEETQNIKK